MSKIPPNYFANTFQNEWNEKRLKFIKRFYGEYWFPKKRILEVACGRGFFGREFKKLGAEVTFTDARSLFVDDLVENGFTAQVMDQDKLWPFAKGSFDLIIHFGVLYHLDNWKQDLKCAVETSPLVFLETETIDSLDPTYEKKIKELPEDYGNDAYDQSFNIVATKFSDTHVEAYLTELGVTFDRYDEQALDVLPTFMYSWKHGELDGSDYHRNTIRRRMWLIGNYHAHP